MKQQTLNGVEISLNGAEIFGVQSSAKQEYTESLTVVNTIYCFHQPAM